MVSRTIYRKGCEDKALSYRDIVRYVYGAGGSISGKYFCYPSGKSAGIYGALSVYRMFGTQAAEVLVDGRAGKEEYKS